MTVHKNNTCPKTTPRNSQLHCKLLVPLGVVTFSDQDSTIMHTAPALFSSNIIIDTRELVEGIDNSTPA